MSCGSVHSSASLSTEESSVKLFTCISTPLKNTQKHCLSHRHRHWQSVSLFICRDSRGLGCQLANACPLQRSRSTTRRINFRG